MLRKALGRGLDDLIRSDGLPEAQPVLDIPIDDIDPNPYQPRREIPEDGLEELAASIEAYGVLQPLIVRRIDDRYQLIAGERRWRAAQRAGLAAVPCIVRGFTDDQTLQVALIENLQREDINPIEAARAYRTLIEAFHLTQSEIAERVGKSRAAVANSLRLLNLPEPVQESIVAGRITEGHGRALLGLLGREAELIAAWRQIEEKGLTVRDSERLVRKVLAPVQDEAETGPRRPSRDPTLADAEEMMQRVLGTKVRIRPNRGGGGTITASYQSADDLARIVDIFRILAR